MKTKTAITSLKVEKDCVNMDCKYCTEKGKCNLETILEETKRLKEENERLKREIELTKGQYSNDRLIEFVGGKQ